MRSSVTINRDYPTGSIAKKVLDAVRPDNRDVPPGTTIEMDVVDNAIHIVVAFTGSLPSFLRTVDDLLICIQAAEAAIRGTT